MSLNLFSDVEPAVSSGPVDVVGRFRAGHLIGKRPQSLSKWRITSDDKTMLESVAESLGGEVQEWDNEKQPFEVFTDAESVPVIVERIFTGMTLWGRNAPIHRCDGQVISYPEDQVGQPCSMAGKPISERKAAAQQGTGCAPDITIRFRLGTNPDLGVFEFKSGSWSLATDIPKVEKELEALGGTAVGTLSLVPVEFTQKSSGEKRKFTKTVLSLSEAA